MAATRKFDLSSSSPEGPTYMNGQRGPYAAASMERLGSIREGMDSRIPLLLPSTLRSGLVSSQVDTVTSLQSLLVDLRAIDQKLPQTRDLEMGSIVGISSEESVPTTFNARHLTSSVEEIRRTKSNLREGTTRARDRAKACCRAALKIDKYCHNLSKKRSRADISSNERSGASVLRGGIPNINPQSNLTPHGLDLRPQKSEERSKGTVPNRRIRTSMVEAWMDVRANGIARPSVPVNKDRDASMLVNDGMALSEEKGQELATIVDGGEKCKMKKKRSVIKSDAFASAALTRLPDADREPKQGMQQKVGTDARPRVNNAHGFRSGPASGVSGVGTLDSDSQQSGLHMHPSTRSDQDNSSLSNDRRDWLAGLHKDGSHLKAVNKPNGHEDNFSSSLNSTTKLNAPARGPRSNSGPLSKATPNIHRVVGNSDDWEHYLSINKISSVVGAINHKHGAALRSSSPPVQWSGQRPQKISRAARRSNFSPVILSHDETPASDTADNASVRQAGLGLTRRLSSNASEQTKVKGDSVQTTGLSEGEESGVADNKSRDKCKKYGENNGQSMHKFAGLVLPSRKNKVAADEDIGDGVRRLRRIGRAFAPTRSGVAGPIEKLDNTAAVKQQRSTRVGCERIESKPGRPPTRKLSEWKGCAQPRHPVINVPLEFVGQSDDDHEELLAAANAALHTRHACSSPFWKRMEPIFGLLSSEDLTYLDQQICCMGKSSQSPLVAGNDGQDLKGDLEYTSLPSTPAAAGRDDFSVISNGITFSAQERELQLAWEMEHVEPFREQLIQGIGARSGVSICQALLSAIIEEEEIENINYNNSREEYLHNSYATCFGVEGGLKSKGSNFHSSRMFLNAERGPSNGFKGNVGWRFHDEPTKEKLESSVILLDSSTVWAKFQYNQMCIDDRILLELSEIGLYPDPVPDLAQGEDEDINNEVNRLEEELHQEVMKKKNLLLKLRKAVTEAGESQKRVLERIALDRLVEMAYEKYVAYWGPSASSSKDVNKINKHAALAFVRRTLARFKKFEAGTTCFDEPPFKDMFLSVCSYSSSAECIHKSADGEGANRFTAMPHSQSTLADPNPNVTSKPVERVDACNKYSDAFRSGNHLSERTFGKEEQWSNKIKKRDLLLDDVVGSTSVAHSRTSSGLGSSLVSGIKGKRSERDREGKEQNRDAASRNSIGRVGRPALSNGKVERKNKTKPKQKTAQLSASVHSLLSNAAELPNAMLPSDPKSHDAIVGRSTKQDDSAVRSSSANMQDMPNDAEAIDLSNLQLPEEDASDLGGHGQDIGSWLNIVDEDGLQDHDFMGLQIPMDDLSEVNVMI